MPRILGVNHHPEIVDRSRQLMILRHKLGPRRDHRGVLRRPHAHAGRDLSRGRHRPAAAPDVGLHASWVRCASTSTGRFACAPPPWDARWTSTSATSRKACGHRTNGLERRTASAAEFTSAERAGVQGGPTQAPLAQPMIPKPPFPTDLTHEQEIEAFEGLQPRLQELWDTIMNREEEPHTSVVVPSLTLDQAELKKLPGASFYEERLLFLLIRLRNPRARMVYVTSQPVHPMILEYYFQFLAGIPASHARVAAHAAVRTRLVAPLADREDPGAAAPDRSASGQGIQDPIAHVHDGLQLDAARAQAGGAARHPAERRRPELTHLGHQVGQPQGLPRGRASTCRWAWRTCAPSTRWRTRCWTCSAQTPNLRRAVIKLNDSFSGEGNALFRYRRRRRGAQRRARVPASISSSPCPARRTRSTSTSSRAWGASSRSSSRRRRRLHPARSCASARAARSRCSRRTTRSWAAPAARSSSAAASPRTTTTG